MRRAGAFVVSLMVLLVSPCFGQNFVCTGANAAFCNTNCNHFPSFCPTGFCTCVPTTCVAVGTQANNPATTDWCRDNCRHIPPNCPFDICSPLCLPTQSNTPSVTPTKSRTPSNTPTRSQTPSNTRSISVSASVSPAPIFELVLPGGAKAFQPATVIVTPNIRHPRALISGVVAVLDGVLVDTIVTTAGTSDGNFATISGLSDGFHTLTVSAQDPVSRSLLLSETVLVGSRTLTVTVLNEAGARVRGAFVNAVLNDNPLYGSSGTTDDSGRFAIRNSPNNLLILLTATANNNQDIGTAVAFDSDTVAIRLISANRAEGFPRNLDFSIPNAAGWTLPSVPNSSRVEPHPGNLKQTNNDLILNTAGSLPTIPITANYTFVTAVSTTAVRVRFRFVTSEFLPFFEPFFNDGFSFLVVVAGVDGGSGTFGSVTSTVTQMGALAFNSNGQSAFTALTVPIPSPGANNKGRNVTVSATVRNGGDDSNDSQLEIDLIEETTFNVVTAELYDGAAAFTSSTPQLQYLSCDAHNYFPDVISGREVPNSGKTLLRAHIRIVGTPGNVVSRVQLEIQGTSQVVQLPLPLPIRIGDSNDGPAVVAFAIPTAVLESVLVPNPAPTNNFEQLILTIRAFTTSGQVSSKDFGPVRVLRRYSPLNRFGIRNGDVGGDDWALQSVIARAKYFVRTFPGILYGDFSNMNGQTFQGHGTRFGSGYEVQATLIARSNGAFLTAFDPDDPTPNSPNSPSFTPTSSRAPNRSPTRSPSPTSSNPTSASANDLIRILNDRLFGNQICAIYVSFAAGSRFARTLREPSSTSVSKVLLDGRAVTSVILPSDGLVDVDPRDGQRTKYFEIVFSENGQKCPGTR